MIAEPQRGFRVAPINAADVSDLTEVRIDIELKCLRRAMSHGNVDWEVAIVAANHALMPDTSRHPRNKRRLDVGARALPSRAGGGM